MASTAFQKRGEVILGLDAADSINFPFSRFTFLHGNGLQKPEVEELASEEEPVAFRPDISDGDIGSLILRPFTGGGIAGKAVKEFYQVPQGDDIRAGQVPLGQNINYQHLTRVRPATISSSYRGALADRYSQKVTFFRGPSSYRVSRNSTF